MLTSDLGRVKDIDRATFSPGDQYDDAVYRSMIQSNLSVVAENASGLTVGYAFVYGIQSQRPNGATFGYVRSIAVHPDHRRQGYARALLAAVIEQADCEVDLFVDEDNEPAINLYRSLGFQTAEMPTALSKQRMVFKRS